MTGSYNLFKIIDRQNKRETMFEVNKDVLRQRYLRPRKVIIHLLIMKYHWLFFSYVAGNATF